jgi:hypothetical protein
MLISFLLPTRKRTHWLHETLDNIKQKTKNHEDIEILLGIDNDDTDTLYFVHNFLQSSSLNITQVITKRFGYHNLHEYINRLCAVSSGKLLFLWNDDALIETQDWDVFIREEYNNKKTDYVVYDFPNNHSGFVFPLVSRKIYECLGHFSLQTHNDTWMQKIVIELGLSKVIDKIKLFHKRADIHEEYKEVEAEIKDHNTSNEFFSKENQDLILKDIEKLREDLLDEVKNKMRLKKIEFSTVC